MTRNIILHAMLTRKTWPVRQYEFSVPKPGHGNGIETYQIYYCSMAVAISTRLDSLSLLISDKTLQLYVGAFSIFNEVGRPHCISIFPAI